MSKENRPRERERKRIVLVGRVPSQIAKRGTIEQDDGAFIAREEREIAERVSKCVVPQLRQV